MNSTATVSLAENHPPATEAEASKAFGRYLGATDLKSLRHLAVKLARNAMDPDDLLQDALERACKAFDRFDPSTSFHAWLRTIMQRLVIDDWRRRGQRREVPIEQLAAPDPAEAEPLWSRYSLDEVRRASVRLPEPVRTTFRLRLVDGLCYTAIAARLNIPPSTVATRLRRARLRMRGLLESAEVTPLRLVAKTEGPEEATSDKACDQWSPRRSPSAQRRPPSRQPDRPTTSEPSPMRSRAAIGGRC